MMERIIAAYSYKCSYLLDMSFGRSAGWDVLFLVLFR